MVAPENVSPNVTSPQVIYKCKPPRYYSYTIAPGQEKAFACSPNYKDIFNVSIPDTGYAIGRATLMFRNNNSNQVYYWGASVIVGSGEISYGQGDDVCPNTSTPVKRILGYGLLTPSNSITKVIGTQGSSPCVDDQVTVFSGGILEVWVEDPDPSCAKKDIYMVSTYKTIGIQKYYWTTSMTQIASLNVLGTPERTRMLVLSAVEGSPEQNPNTTCGSESATLVAQVVTNLQGAIDTQIDTIPASQGMGHLVLSPQALVSYAPTVSQISLYVGSNTEASIFTNDCCGDAKLGYVKLP